MLDFKNNFINSLSNNSNYLYYVVYIDVVDGIYLSNKKGSHLGNRGINGEFAQFYDLNLQVSNISESIDLSQNKFKTSRVDISVSNSNIISNKFTDLLNEYNFIGAKVNIYVASDASKNFDDCIMIYTGYISEMESDIRSCKFSIEDYSTYTFKNKTLPKRKNTQTTQEQIEGSQNVSIPFVYGQVDNSKMVMTRPHINDLKTYIYPDAVNQGIQILGFSTDYRSLKVFRDKMYLSIPPIFQEVGSDDDPLIINGINYNLLYVGTPQYEIAPDYILIEKKTSGTAFTQGMPLNIQAREQFQVDVERTPSGIQPTSSDSILTYGFAGDQQITFNGHQNGYNISDSEESFTFPIPHNGVPLAYYENMVIGHLTRRFNTEHGEDSGSIWYLNHCLTASMFYGQYEPEGRGLCEIVRHPSAEEVVPFLNLPEGYSASMELTFKISPRNIYTPSGEFVRYYYPSWDSNWGSLPEDVDFGGYQSIEDYWINSGFAQYFDAGVRFANTDDTSVQRHPSLRGLGIGSYGSWSNVPNDRQSVKILYGYRFSNGIENIDIRLDEDLRPFIDDGIVDYNAVRWIEETGDGLSTSKSPRHDPDIAADVVDFEAIHFNHPISGDAQFTPYEAGYHTPTLRKYLFGRRITADEHTSDGGSIPLGSWVYGCFPVIGAFNPKYANLQESESSGDMYVYDLVGDGLLSYGNPYFYGVRDLDTGEIGLEWDKDSDIPTVQELNNLEIQATPTIELNANHQWSIGIHTNYGYGFGKLLVDWYGKRGGGSPTGYNEYGFATGASHNIRPVLKNRGVVARSGGAYCPIEYTNGQAKAVKMDITFNSVTGADIIQGSVFSMFKCKLNIDFALIEKASSTDDSDTNIDFLVEADCFKIYDGDVDGSNGGKGHNDIVRKQKINTLDRTELGIGTVVDANGNTWEELVPVNPYKFSTGHDVENSDYEHLSDLSLNVHKWIDDNGDVQYDNTTIQHECDALITGVEQEEQGLVNAWRENLSSVDNISLTFRLGRNYGLSDFVDPLSQNFDLNSQLNEEAHFPDNIVRGKFKCFLNNISLKQRFIVGNVSQLDYYGNVLGRIDEPDGYYTGQESLSEQESPSIDWLITKPCDILLHILDKELDNTREYDQNSLEIARAKDWRFDFCHSEEMGAKEFIEEFSKSCYFIPRFRADDNFSYINIYSQEVVMQVKSKDVIKFKYKKSKSTDMVLKCRVSYNWDEGLKTYLSETNISGQGAVPTNLADYIENYNVKDIDDFYVDFKSKFIKDSETAIKLRNHILNWNKNMHNIIECELPVNYIVLEVGDVIEFDSVIAGNKIFGMDYTQTQTLNGQEVYNRFLVTKIKKSTSSVKATFMQCHSMDSEEVVNSDVTAFNTEEVTLLGDLNRDGNIDILDAVQTVNGIINSDLSSSQAFIADLNQDGYVDVLDLVALIGGILDES